MKSQKYSKSTLRASFGTFKKVLKKYSKSTRKKLTNYSQKKKNTIGKTDPKLGPRDANESEHDSHVDTRGTPSPKAYVKFADL